MKKLPFLFAAMMLPTSAFAQPISLTIGQDIQPEQAIEDWRCSLDDNEYYEAGNVTDQILNYILTKN